VQTIKRNFGISIDNYAQVDFASFEKLVEVLGGVPVYFTTPVRDRTTGLYVDTPGCVRLNPQQALAYARSRHFEFEFMGKWLTDGTGDLGRITRQQDFIKRAIRSASDKGVRNPQTAVGIVDAAVGAVVLDDTLTVDAILGLLSQFRTFNPDDLVTNQVPTESAPRDGVAYQDVVWGQALPLLEPFWGVDPAVGVQPRNVIVDVRSASGDQDRANLVASAFDARGFDAEAYTNRSGSGGVTITYGPAGRDAAVLVARYLDIVPDLKLDESIVGNRVILDVNGQVDGVRDDPKPLEELPEEFQPIPTTTTVPPTTAPVDPSAPETTLPADGAPPDAAPPGVVPTDPERAAACR
jgi:LCP family protein required for cell wall assembly